jgi:hypothetical protein
MWEYKFLDLAIGSNWDDGNKLNELGRQGWELVASYLLPAELSPISRYTRYILKRHLKAFHDSESSSPFDELRLSWENR